MHVSIVTLFPVREAYEMKRTDLFAHYCKLQELVMSCPGDYARLSPGVRNIREELSTTWWLKADMRLYISQCLFRRGGGDFGDPLPELHLSDDIRDAVHEANNWSRAMTLLVTQHYAALVIQRRLKTKVPINAPLEEGLRQFILHCDQKREAFERFTGNNWDVLSSSFESADDFGQHYQWLVDYNAACFSLYRSCHYPDASIDDPYIETPQAREILRYLMEHPALCSALFPQYQAGNDLGCEQLYRLLQVPIQECQIAVKRNTLMQFLREMTLGEETCSDESVRREIARVFLLVCDGCDNELTVRIFLEWAKWINQIIVDQASEGLAASMSDKSEKVFGIARDFCEALKLNVHSARFMMTYYVRQQACEVLGGGCPSFKDVCEEFNEKFRGFVSQALGSHIDSDVARCLVAFLYHKDLNALSRTQKLQDRLAGQPHDNQSIASLPVDPKRDMPHACCTLC
jgi:hypothetical protein